MAEIIQEDPVPILEEDSNDSATICLDLFHLAEEDDSFEELLKKRNIRGLSEHELKVIDMTLKILENWKLIKRISSVMLVHLVKETLEMEDEIENLEDSLNSRNIEIDEDAFLAFCQAHEASEPTEDFSEILRKFTFQDKELSFQASGISTPITRKPKKTEIIDKFVASYDGMVVIGTNGTMVSKNALQSINWSLSGAALTRKILMEVFDRKTLAFCTLTGDWSPDFMYYNKPIKNQLDPLKVADIIHMVMEHTELSAKEVKYAITTKCADENKIFRLREKKRQNAALKLQRKRKLN